MTHLGDRVTDLVDGQLSPEATETAHAHLAGCLSCREAVEAERLMKSRLASLAGPGPSSDLVGRLLAIGGGAALAARDAADADTQAATAPHPADAELPPWESDRDPVRSGSRVVRGAGVPGRPVQSRPAAGRPGGRPDGVRPSRVRPARRRRLAAAVVGALSMVGVGAAGLTFSVTALSPGTVLPPVATFVVEHAALTGGLPFVDVPGFKGDDEGTRTGTTTP